MQTETIYRLARTYNVELTPDEVAAMKVIMDCRRLEKGVQVSELHRHTHHMFYIGQGILRQYYYKGGRDITEHFGTEGDVMFCIESLFLNRPSELGIETIEPSIIHTIDYAAFKGLSNVHCGINRLYQGIVERSLILSQRKADSWRFESSQERYNRFCREYPDVARRATVAHIASYLLMSPETLSRVRAGML